MFLGCLVLRKRNICCGLLTLLLKNKMISKKKSVSFQSVSIKQLCGKFVKKFKQLLNTPMK